jgi:hypothetical protein
MYAVSYYMKDKAKDSKPFATLKEAQAFALALNTNPECESYRIHFPNRN